jgi:hypothetical protein
MNAYANKVAELESHLDSLIYDPAHPELWHFSANDITPIPPCDTLGDTPIRYTICYGELCAMSAWWCTDFESSSIAEEALGTSYNPETNVWCASYNPETNVWCNI